MRKIIGISTEYYDKDFSRFDYMPLAKLMVDEFRELGMEAQILGKPGFPNVIARLRGIKGKPSLLIEGHYNTVPIGDRSAWTHDPFAGEVEGDAIYGRGVIDMKGGIAATMVAIKTLVESGVKLNGDLLFFWWAGEGASEHSVDWIKQNHPDAIKADYALTPEGTFDIATCGLMWIELVTRGKSEHTPMAFATPHARQEIRNALSYMRKLLSAMEKVDDWMTWETEPMFPDAKPLCSVNVIECGEKVNIIPDRCRAEVDIRFLPSQNKDRILKELDVLIGKLKTEDSDFEIEKVKLFYHLPANKVAQHDYITTIQNVVEEVLGFKPKTTAGGSFPLGDGSIPLGKVADIILKGSLAHVTNEWASIDSLVDLTKVYAALYCKILG